MNKIILIITIMGVISCSSTKQISELYSQSESLENKTFRYEQIQGLSQPVKRYLKYALRDGQPYLSQLRLKHTGQFKTGLGKDWVDSNYQEVDGIMVPGEIEASWLLEEGEHTYARFQVKGFEFNTPKPW
jgi:hypothetical protein